MRFCTSFPYPHILTIKNDFRYPSRQTTSTLVVTDKNATKIVNKPLRQNILLNGLFQSSSFYAPYRENIKQFFQLPEQKINSTDILLHIRCTDYFYFYGSSRVLHPDYYLSILEKEQFNRVVIVTDDPYCAYLQYFKKYSPVILSRGIQEDFYTILKYKKVILSNSTFGWWGCFLGNAEKIYTPKQWVGTTRFSKYRQLHDIEGGIPQQHTFISREKVYSQKEVATDFQ
jgi:hypothetical protein